VVTGRLEGWVWDDRHLVIWGFIFGDTRKRFSDGTWIHTSLIEKKFKDATEGDVVETLNSKYLLGKPLVKDTKVSGE